MKKFQSLGRSLSAGEMKGIRGGDESVMSVDGGSGCLEVWTYDCSTSKPCCSPAKCEDNATNSGTICVIR